MAPTFWWCVRRESRDALGLRSRFSQPEWEETNWGEQYTAKTKSSPKNQSQQQVWRWHRRRDNVKNATIYPTERKACECWLYFMTCLQILHIIPNQLIKHQPKNRPATVTSFWTWYRLTTCFNSKTVLTASFRFALRVTTYICWIIWTMQSLCRWLPLYTWNFNSAINGLHSKEKVVPSIGGYLVSFTFRFSSPPPYFSVGPTILPVYQFCSVG